jgi:hypothetical protein
VSLGRWRGWSRRSGVAAGGEAEVEDAGAAVGADEYVLGLEVAVDEAGGVGGGEASAGLAEHREDLAARGAGAWLFKPLRKVWPWMNSMARKTWSPSSPTS